MVSTATAYHLVTRNLDRSLAVEGGKPSVALESKYFLSKIADIRSVDDFVKDTRLFNYAMKAFGLEDLAYAKGLVRKILTEGVDDSKSLAHRIDDPRFLELATTFNFQRDGEDATNKTDARQGVVDRYVRQTLETESGEDNEGVRLALYFQRKAPAIDSYFDILADPALSRVVKTALGLPDAMATADIDKQAAALKARFDIADLADPVKLDRLITRFAAGYDATENTSVDPVLTLFTGAGAAPSFDLGLILTLQNLKHGG